MEFLKTLTPIWTGDANRTCDRIHETGIIGSLRWWYEAVVRGLGYRACDLTDDKCEFKTSAYRKAEKTKMSKEEAIKHGLEGVCPVCQLFGCTGWGRKFRVVIHNNSEDLGVVEDLSIRNRQVRKYNNNSPVYYKVPIRGLCTLNNNLKKPVILKLVPLRMEDMEYRILNKIFKLIEKYGGLGANLSQGNGVVKIIESELDKYIASLPSSDKTIMEWIKERAKNGTSGNLPALDKFFFGEFQLVFSQSINSLLQNGSFFDEDSNSRKLSKSWQPFWNKYEFLPIAPHIRYAIRYAIPNKKERYNIFGELGVGSKVFVSHGYKTEKRDHAVNFRIYGYSLSDDEIKKIGDKLKHKLEIFLFQDDKKSSRIEQLKINSSFLIKDKAATDLNLSQVVIKGGEGMLNDL